MKNNFWKKFNDDEMFRNKTILSLVFVVGIVALVLNVKSLGNLLSDPLKDKNKESLDNLYKVYNELKSSGRLVEDKNTTPTDEEIKSSIDSVVKNDGTDTDGDGITDYDEINIFSTSMYLKDSDGDGLSDDKEIKNGTNPNCAEGTNCSGVSSTAISNTDSSIMNVDSLDINKIREELKKIAPESVKSMVDTMTDEQVRTVFAELYKTQNTNTTSGSGSSLKYVDELKLKLPEFTPQQISMMKDMDEQEIVDILVESGIAEKSFLSQFKSGQVKNIVLGLE